MTAPLLGHNLVRLLYLDETGTASKASALSVVGVIVHGDNEWPQIDARIAALIEKYIAPASRLGFVFHATDIFHGSEYFDRRKPEWSEPEQRWPVLVDLAAIIDDLSLPVVAGSYKKDEFGLGVLAADDHVNKGQLMHNTAVMDCLMWADRWLARFAPTELATVIHEDGTPAKKLIKLSVQILRNATLMELAGMSNTVRTDIGLPLKRIIDTVHFAEKADARPLQLADLCAFILGRVSQSRPVPDLVWQVILKRLEASRAHPVADELAARRG